MAFIYSLSHPLTKEIRYIGKANNIQKRLKSHLSDSKKRNTPLYCWIRKLLGNGLTPEINIIDECEDWIKSEKQLIKKYREEGYRLLNLADGGDEPYCSKGIRANNGRIVSEMINSDEKRKRIANIKRMLTKNLEFLKENGKTEAYNRIVEKLKLGYSKNPKLLASFQTFNKI